MIKNLSPGLVWMNSGTKQDLGPVWIRWRTITWLMCNLRILLNKPWGLQCTKTQSSYVVSKNTTKRSRLWNKSKLRIQILATITRSGAPSQTMKSQQEYMMQTDTVAVLKNLRSRWLRLTKELKLERSATYSKLFRAPILWLWKKFTSLKATSTFSWKIWKEVECLISFKSIT